MRVDGLWFVVWGLGFWVQGSEVRVWGLGFEIWGLGFEFLLVTIYQNSKRPLDCDAALLRQGPAR